MRFMIVVKGDASAEGVGPPTEEMFAMMTKYNEELADAGILIAAEGLLPLKSGTRIKFSAGDKRTVVENPTAKEPSEVLAGFWMIQVKSKQEAIDWAKKVPNPFPDLESEIDIRQVSESDDFGDAMTPELREREKRLAEKIAENAKR